MKSVRRLFDSFSGAARAKRAAQFREMFSLDEQTRILDLGCEDGSNINRILTGTRVRPENVHIADIYEESVAEGEKSYGYRGTVLSEEGPLPFGDDEFDVVYCSSVIEHVTLPKSELWDCRSGREFRTRSFARQMDLANEIRRIGRRHFVQTPAVIFPIESHTWLPLAGYLPRRALLPVLRFFNRFWEYRIDPDFNLLSRHDMQKLFPDSEIIGERKFGFTKSWMAVKSARDKSGAEQDLPGERR